VTMDGLSVESIGPYAQLYKVSESTVLTDISSVCYEVIEGRTDPFRSYI
jgi:hypothetical protein